MSKRSNSLPKPKPINANRIAITSHKMVPQGTGSPCEVNSANPHPMIPPSSPESALSREYPPKAENRTRRLKYNPSIARMRPSGILHGFPARKRRHSHPSQTNKMGMANPPHPNHLRKTIPQGEMNEPLVRPVRPRRVNNPNVTRMTPRKSHPKRDKRTRHPSRWSSQEDGSPFSISGSRAGMG